MVKMMYRKSHHLLEKKRKERPKEQSMHKHKKRKTTKEVAISSINGG
jgi:hypothetical protein